MTIAIDLSGRESARPVSLVCASRDDGEVGEVREPGWASELSEEQRGVVRMALDGFLVLLAARPPTGLVWDDWVAYWSKRAD